MAKPQHEAEDPRRAFLLKALAAGLLSAGGIPGAAAQIFGKRPQRLPAGQSVYEATGPVTVNGQAASGTTRIAPGDRIETGAGAQLIFVVGADAFILRENSRVEISGTSAVIGVARLLTGALLSVFGRGTPKRDPKKALTSQLREDLPRVDVPIPQAAGRQESDAVHEVDLALRSGRRPGVGFS